MSNIPNFKPEAVIGPEIWASAYELLARCAQSLAVLEEAAINQSSLADIEQVIVLTTQPIVLGRLNRDYMRVWALASTSVTIDNLTGFATFNLAAGWTELNLAEGARIATSAGTATLLFRWSDNPVAVSGV